MHFRVADMDTGKGGSAASRGSGKSIALRIKGGFRDMDQRVDGREEYSEWRPMERRILQRSIYQKRRWRPARICIRP